MLTHRRKGIGARLSDVGENGTSGSGIQLHLDATAPNALLDAESAVITADDAVIARWVDISGNARHFSQGTADKMPVIENDVLNNVAVKFDGTDDFLEAGEFYTYVDSTFFIVFKNSNTTGTETLFSDRGGNNNEQLLIRTSGNYLKMLAKDDGGNTIGEITPDSTSGIDNGVAGIIKLSASSATPKGSVSASGTAFKDATQASYASDTAFGGNAEDPTIGARNSGDLSPANFFAGHILEVAIWPRVLTVPELNKLLKIASLKYGLTVSTLA
jgi:hypothetical protein